jgi:hypothetical protein
MNRKNNRKVSKIKMAMKNREEGENKQCPWIINLKTMYCKLINKKEGNEM